MRKKINFPHERFLIAAFLITSFFLACNKSKDADELREIAQLNGDKQLFDVQFSLLKYELQDGLERNDLGVRGKKEGSFAVSEPIALKSFEKPAPFISVYGTWNGQSIDNENVILEINSSADGKNWLGWMQFRASNDAELTAQRQVFNNIELDAAVKFIQIKITFKNTAAQLQNASVYFFNPAVTSPAMQALIDAEANRISAEAAGMEAGVYTEANPALCAKPGFTSRSTWGARAAKNSPSYTTVNFLIVHHENGSNSSSDWAARVRSVQNFHMDTNGWSDIGYNYLVDPNGVSYEGRGGGENVIGAHNCGKNAQTMGICMLGTYTSVKPTNNAQYTLKRILAWKAKQRGIDVLGTGYLVDRTINRVTGHRASCATSCPGDALWNDLSRLRNDVKTNFINQCN